MFKTCRTLSLIVAAALFAFMLGAAPATADDDKTGEKDHQSMCKEHMGEGHEGKMSEMCKGHMKDGKTACKESMGEMSKEKIAEMHKKHMGEMGESHTGEMPEMCKEHMKKMKKGHDAHPDGTDG